MRTLLYAFFFQAEDGIRDGTVTGVQTCALPILLPPLRAERRLPVDVRLDAVAVADVHRRLAFDAFRGALERGDTRSEERRVGKECRYRRLPNESHEKECNDCRSVTTHNIVNSIT